MLLRLQVEAPSLLSGTRLTGLVVTSSHTARPENKSAKCKRAEVSVDHMDVKSPSVVHSVASLVQGASHSSQLQFAGNVSRNHTRKSDQVVFRYCFI